MAADKRNEDEDEEDEEDYEDVFARGVMRDVLDNAAKFLLHPRDLCRLAGASRAGRDVARWMRLREDRRIAKLPRIADDKLVADPCVRLWTETWEYLRFTLDLSHCTSVVDVNALGGVHTLNLAGCDRVVDVSALGGVHHLTLPDGRVVERD